MLFQTEKLSSFHCCKLWILLYFFVNIESITASEPRCEPIAAVANGRVRCTNSNLIGSKCLARCNFDYHGFPRPIQYGIYCSYNFSRSTTEWIFRSPSQSINPCTLNRIVKKECYGPSRIDMVFVLDGSGSISSESFEHVKTWTKRVGELMIRVFGDHVHIGIIQFSSTIEVEAKLHIFPNTAKFDVKVNKINQLRDMTNTVDAMNKAREILDQERPECPDDYQKIMVLLTDGHNTQSREGLVAEAKLLQDAGVISFAVGVENADDEELKIIANGHEDRIFNVDDFEFLHDHAHNVHVEVAKTLEITCEPRTAPENGDVSCPHANELGSECKYTCDAGYKISNPLLSTTYCKIQTTGVGGWSNPPPTCISTPNCEDKDARCAMFQIPGMEMYCSYLKEMSRNCPKTCGFC